MKITRIVALLVMAAMLAPMAACTSAPAPTPTAAPVQTTEASVAPTVEPTPEQMKELELTLNIWSMSTFDPATDAEAKMIADKFKLMIKPVVLEGDGLKLAAASKSLPDVFHFGVLYDPNTFNSWVNQGIVRDIPDNMLAGCPNILKVMLDNPTTVAAKDIYKKNWFIVVPNCMDRSLYPVKWSGVYYRKDWLTNVGITKAPTDFNEFHDMLSAFVKNDPDKNGKNDTYGMTLNGGMWFIMEWFTNWGADVECWQKEDGKWIPGYLSKNCIAPLEYAQKLYQEGQIDTEFTTNNASQAMQKFSGNTFGVVLRNADTFWLWNVVVNQFGSAHPDIADPFTVVGLLPPMAKDASSKPAVAESVDRDGMMFRAGLEDEKLQRYLMLHDWLLTEEGKYLQLGFEGEQYKKDKDGKVITFNDPKTGKPYEIYKLFPANGLLYCATYGFDFDADPNWPSTDYRDNVRQAAKDFRESYAQYPYPRNIKMMFLSTPAKDSLAFDPYGEMAMLVMGNEPIATAWDKYVQKALDAGCQAAIDEVNAAAPGIGLQ